MDFHTIKTFAGYGSVGLYIGVAIIFLIFALLGLRQGPKRFFVTAAIGLVWPLFIIVIILRQFSSKAVT